MKVSSLMAATFVALLAACSPSKSAGPSSRTLAFPPLDIGSGQELLGSCQSLTLNNDQPLFVNAVEMAAGPAWHHANWFYVPDTKYPGADGTWECASRGYDELSAGTSGGVLFAQSTQSSGETQQFPAGAAMRIPPHSRIVGGIHLVNASTADVHGTAITLTLKTIPESQVTAKLKALSVEYHPLDIPPNARSRFTGKCDVHGGGSMDFRIYYVLPHYHQYGTKLTLTTDGPHGPQTVFANGGTIGESWGRTLDPPIDVRDQTHMEFSCEYDNTTAGTLHWGNADGEMCVLLAYTDSPWEWGGGVFQSNAVTGTDGNGVILNEGPCSFGSL